MTEPVPGQGVYYSEWVRGMLTEEEPRTYRGRILKVAEYLAIIAWDDGSVTATPCHQLLLMEQDIWMLQ